MNLWVFKIYINTNINKFEPSEIIDLFNNFQNNYIYEIIIILEI